MVHSMWSLGMAQMKILRSLFCLILLTISPQCPLAQYPGLDYSFGGLGVNSSWPQEDHVPKPDYVFEDMESHYEEKDKPDEMLSLKTLMGDFAEMENLLKQFEKDKIPQESQNNRANMSSNGAVKIVLPRLRQVQQFINTQNNNSQILSLMEETLRKWAEEIAGKVDENNLGLKASIDELKKVFEGIKLSIKHLVEKVEIRNKESADALKKIILENTNKEEAFGKMVARLVKTVDGMKEKSSNLEKVTSIAILSVHTSPKIYFHCLQPGN